MMLMAEGILLPNGKPARVKVSRKEVLMGLYKRDRVWWMRFNFNGRQIRRSCETTSKKLAEKIFCKVMSNVTEGKFFEVDPRETTFNELCKDLETDYRINKRRTADRLGRTLRHLKGTFEGMKAEDISTSFIQNYIIKRQDAGAANATINREMAALKRMFTLGFRTTPRKVTSVPYIHHLQENNVRQGYFEHNEFIALRNALPPTP